MNSLLKRSPGTRYCMLLLLLGLISTGIAETKKTDGMDDALNEKRDPFWPVGYVPDRIKKAVEKKNGQAESPAGSNWNEAMKKIVINGVSSRANNQFYAVINGQVKSVGDTVTLRYEGTIYTWAVDGIKPPGSVKLRRVSAL